MILTILIIVDLVGHGEEGGVLLQPVLHVVQQVLVSLHHLLLQQLTRETVNIFLQIVSDKIFTWRCATLSWNWYQSALHSPSLRLRSCARSESSGDSTRSSSSSINSPEKSSSSAIVLRINIFSSVKYF